jgi:hypothetical protein
MQSKRVVAIAGIRYSLSNCFGHEPHYSKLLFFFKISVIFGCMDSEGINLSQQKFHVGGHVVHGSMHNTHVKVKPTNSFAKPKTRAEVWRMD